jgi:hypothetical protein
LGRELVAGRQAGEDLVLIIGYPAIGYRRAIRRSFQSVSFY